MLKNNLIDVETVLDLMLDAVCIVDLKGNFIFVSAAFEHIFGYTAAEVVGENMINYVYQDDHHKTQNVVSSLLYGNAKNPQFENRWVRKDGNVVHILWSVRWSEDHQVRVAVAHDITERKIIEKRLHHMANYDALTDLPNRFSLMDMLQHTLVTAQQNNTVFALLFVDIDKFKAVNDTYGHTVGDQLLHRIAQRLSYVVKDSGTVGRLGGDEFLIILDRLKQPIEATFVKRKIIAQFKIAFEFEDINLNINPSIGLAIFPNDGQTSHELIKYADKAMYKIKQNT